MVLGDFGAATTTSKEGSTGGAGSTMSAGDESTWIGDRHEGGGVGIKPGDRRVVAILPPSLLPKSIHETPGPWHLRLMVSAKRQEKY